MFSCARQTSQGRQQTYTCSTFNMVDEDTNETPRIIKMPKLTRQTRQPSNTIFDLRLDNMSNDIGLLSHNILSPYLSKGVVSLMRDVSGDQDL
jgi:hypothetical protein